MHGQTHSWRGDRRIVITALGAGQILAWGTSFYFPAVFAETIVRETGWSLGMVVGGTSLGLLVAGLISPQVGKLIGRHGGRPVLLASSLFFAAGLVGVGLAPALPVYLAAWVLLGARHGHRAIRCGVRRAQPHVRREARAGRSPTSLCSAASPAPSAGRSAPS